MAIIYPSTTNGLQKTLDANLLTGVTASATFNNVTGIQNKLGLFVVDRVDGNNNLTPNKREYISFTGTSGSTVVTLTRGLGGSTDQDHAVGAIVEFVNDVVQQQAIIDGLLLTVTTAGVLNRATGANVNTGTDDDKIVTPKAIADSNLGSVAKASAWTSTTPTVTSETGTLTTKSCTMRHIQIGKTVLLNMVVTITTKGTGNGAIIIPLPISSSAYFTFVGRDNAITGASLTGFAANGNINILKYDNTSIIADNLLLTMSGIYEII